MKQTLYTPYKIRSLKVKQFIAGFNFPEPNWDNLPEGFPNCDTSELTSKEEQHLFDAIKTAWIVSGGGRQAFYKAVAKRVAVAAAIVFVLFAGKNLVTNNQSATKAVSAKTVSEKVEKIIESTRSAIFR